MTTDPRSAVSLLVIYTERLDECRAFYAGLGLPMVRERHGDGPVHHAVELGNGVVLEIYPGAAERVTGRLRLGLRVPVSDDVEPGPHRLTDPDGRVVVVEAVGEG